MGLGNIVQLPARSTPGAYGTNGYDGETFDKQAYKATYFDIMKRANNAWVGRNPNSSAINRHRVHRPRMMRNA